MAITISISSFKGGVAKTTSTANIGRGLFDRGYKVLLIDLDPQHNLTQSLGEPEPKESVYHSLVKSEPLPVVEIAKKDTSYFHLVPASLQLIRAELEMAAMYKREEKLNNVLRDIAPRYDYILMDCPPSLGLLTINAYAASDLIFSPVGAEYLSLKGLDILSQTLDSIGLEIDRIFITNYDARKALSKSVLESIQNDWGNKVFNTIIRTNVALAEAPAFGLDVFQHAPESHGATDYSSLIDEILTFTRKNNG
jgi:chromosome partitioning protein